MDVRLYSYPGDTIISVMADFTARFSITKLSLEYRKHSVLLCYIFCVTSLTKTSPATELNLIAQRCYVLSFGIRKNPFQSGIVQ